MWTDARLKPRRSNFAATTCQVLAEYMPQYGDGLIEEVERPLATANAPLAATASTPTARIVQARRVHVAGIDAEGDWRDRRPSFEACHVSCRTFGAFPGPRCSRLALRDDDATDLMTKS